MTLGNKAQFVSECRIFEFSETVLVIWTSKLTVLTSYQYQIPDIMSLFLETSHNVKGVETLADLNGYYVHLILLQHIYQFFRHSLHHIQDILLCNVNNIEFLMTKVTNLTLALKRSFSLRMLVFLQVLHLYYLNKVNGSRFL